MSHIALIVNPLATAVDEMVLFVLRGMGLTSEALSRYATPEAFRSWRKNSD